jgi:chromosome segregation ATPase
MKTERIKEVQQHLFDIGCSANGVIAREIIAVLDQLEAERQRADAAESNYSNEADSRKRVEQNYVRLEAEIAVLKAKLANPVVLGSSDVMSRNFAVKAIIAAGFTVKGYLPTEQLVFEGVRP